LYALIGYGGISLIQLLVQWMQILDRAGPGMFGRGEIGIHVLFGFALLKMVVFLLAMVAFVAGLRSVRLREPISDDAEH